MPRYSLSDFDPRKVARRAARPDGSAVDPLLMFKPELGPRWWSLAALQASRAKFGAVVAVAIGLGVGGGIGSARFLSWAERDPALPLRPPPPFVTPELLADRPAPIRVPHHLLRPMAEADADAASTFSTLAAAGGRASQPSSRRGATAAGTIAPAARNISPQAIDSSARGTGGRVAAAAETARSAASQFGSLSINAAPWADVWVDGRPVGATPLANLRVTVGEHEILWRHPQLGERRQSVTVTSSEPARAAVDLRR
jgi:hypothetical protein